MIEDFANTHCLVSQFQAEMTDGVHAVDGYNYPLVFLNPLNKSLGSNNGNYNWQVQIYILDYPQGELFEQAEYCFLKAHKIANDLRDFLAVNKKRVPQDFTVNVLSDYAFDKVQGVEVTLSVIDAGGCRASIPDLYGC
ncbi:hypothetical protein N9251_03410 [Gammaproteobacteria bacterium]|nr:hypothetical protein [Gammaproteobacteria bacterium]